MTSSNCATIAWRVPRGHLRRRYPGLDFDRSELAPCKPLRLIQHVCGPSGAGCIADTTEPAPSPVPSSGRESVREQFQPVLFKTAFLMPSRISRTIQDVNRANSNGSSGDDPCGCKPRG
jgi:hypothetical protein